MNKKMLLRLLSYILLIEAAALLAPSAVAVYYSESPFPFFLTVTVLLVLSLPGLSVRPESNRISAKDGFVLVSISWVLMSLFGALPFVISGAIPDYVDAFFETVSGFTTTGSTVLSEIGSLPRGILFWRSETHWIGGMGVLMLMLAIMPSGNGNVIHLLRAEVPGPTKGKLAPKMRDSSMILYGIYIGMTVLMIIALLLTGMDFYDSVVNSMATAGTGGFAVLNNSIAGYSNPAAEWIIAVFMFLFGINFNLYFLILIGRFRDALRSEELRVFLSIAICSVALIFINIGTNAAYLFDSVGDCVRASFFQVGSIMSTTGFSTVDFDLWPGFSKSILLVLMFFGACAGSTAGGLKISRVIILLKSMKNEIRHLLHPNSVNVVKMDAEAVPEETIKATRSYLVVYCFITVGSVLLLSLDGLDLETNITSVISCFNNIGPGLGRLVGPAGNMSVFSSPAKILLSLDMLLGRLEILPFLTLFSIVRKK